MPLSTSWILHVIFTLGYELVGHRMNSTTIGQSPTFGPRIRPCWESSLNGSPTIANNLMYHQWPEEECWAFPFFKIEFHKNTVSFAHLLSYGVDSNPWKEKRLESVEDVGLKSMPLYSIGIPRADETFLKDSKHAILETIKSVFENSPGSFSYQLVYSVLSSNNLLYV